MDSFWGRVVAEGGNLPSPTFNSYAENIRLFGVSKKKKILKNKKKLKIDNT
jgi:hypothetical protein